MTISPNTIERIAQLGLSSTYDSQKSRLNFMGTTPSRKYGEKPWVDPLDPRLLKIFRGRIPYSEFAYDGKPITTISYKFYNTTSLYWLILAFNGILHQQFIPDGAILKIPSLSYIQNRIEAAKVNNSGRVVTI